MKGIRSLKTTCEEEYKEIGDDQLMWELTKFKLREYFVKYQIEHAKKVSSEEKSAGREAERFRRPERCSG